MDNNHRMEHFSKAFVRAYAAPLGFNPSELEYDNDSIDIKLSGKDFIGKYRSPELHIQLKSTADVFNKNGILPFQLSKKNYDDLRGENIAFPRYLFVFILPQKTEDWIIENDTNIQLFKRGYWLSLRTAPDIKNQKSKVVHIPIKNLLSKEKLYEMMAKSSDGLSL